MRFSRRMIGFPKSSNSRGQESRNRKSTNPDRRRREIFPLLVQYREDDLFDPSPFPLGY